MTRKQRDLLFFICRELDSKSVSPSYSEMCDALGTNSKSNIVRLITLLEEEGLVTRTKHRRRSIEVTDKGLSEFDRNGGVSRCFFCGRI